VTISVFPPQGMGSFCSILPRKASRITLCAPLDGLDCSPFLLPPQDGSQSIMHGCAWSFFMIVGSPPPPRPHRCRTIPFQTFYTLVHDTAMEGILALIPPPPQHKKVSYSDSRSIPRRPFCRSFLFMPLFPKAFSPVEWQIRIDRRINLASFA